jgi:hypothetical protein
MKTFLQILFLSVFVALSLYSQDINKNKSSTDWSYTIDTTWGAGLNTTEKLQVFDAYWSKIDQTWGGFPNLDINWDSLKNFYRPIVEAGVSRGRFEGILCRLSLALNEWHSWIKDPGVDSIFGIYYKNTGTEIEYPNFPSFNYRPGVPLLNLSPVFRSNFGAGITAFEDSIALVYSVMPNHPLNLEPGDIILGYDGLPWKENLKDLLDQELPLLYGGGYSAASPESRNHANVISIGLNWGLFNTIDVLKYSSGDTLHYQTSLLNSISEPYFICTEQMPVNGVPFPDLNQNKMISWGIVEGTNIGYIYVWDWYEPITQTLFSQAVDELMHQQNVTGLIIDLRLHQGGEIQYANDGFKQLFNFDPTSNFSGAIRVPGNDHLNFNIETPWSFFFFTPTSEIFDRPIAVLTGPFCGSAGDYNAFRLRFHPMTRFFGKKTATAYTYINGTNFYSSNNYKFRVDNGSLYSDYNNEGYLIHKGFPVDEEVWLTPDGVAKGQDDVVNRALEWMNNLVYPHNIILDKSYYALSKDTVHLSAIIENPNSHQISARSYIKTVDDILVDSIDLSKQTVNDTSENWTVNIIPTVEEFYKVSVTAFDQSSVKSFTLPNATGYTTAGPLTVDSIAYLRIGNLYYFRPFIRNLGNVKTVKSATIRMKINDPWVISVSSSAVSLPDIAPGSLVSASSWLTTSVDSTLPGYFNIKFEMMSGGYVYWTDSIKYYIPGWSGIENEETIPIEYSLSQNYPNPFNPSTKIKYSVPQTSQVKIKVFDVLGNEIETLVNELKPVGIYELTWNSSNLPSGVYFYQLKAGSFVQTKKMILLK